jgi:hypothetical protein
MWRLVSNPSVFSTKNPASRSDFATQPALVYVAKIAPFLQSGVRAAKISLLQMVSFFAGENPSKNHASALKSSSLISSLASPIQRSSVIFLPKFMRWIPLVRGGSFLIKILAKFWKSKHRGRIYHVVN